MGGRHEPSLRRRGGVLQSALPKSSVPRETRRANGLNVRGAVVKIYPRDDPPPGGLQPASTYASVLVYGVRRVLMPRVLVTQPTGSLYTGQVGGLRAVQRGVDLDHADPATLDCSHVVVSFLDDDLAQPYISAVMEHPRADGGGSIEGEVVDRVRLSKDDGQPLLQRWNGAVWGLDGIGDFLLDLRKAFDGVLDTNGEEPAPATDGSRGNFRARLPKGATLTLEIEDGPTVEFDLSKDAAKMTLGDGTHSVAVAQYLKTLYDSLAQQVNALVSDHNSFVNNFLGHQHAAPSGGGATTGAQIQLPSTVSAPSWDSRIESDKLKIPDTD